VSMYTVVKREGKILVLDADERPVFTSSEDGYIVWRGKVAGSEDVLVSRVKDLSDTQLLTAIAKAVKLV